MNTFEQSNSGKKTNKEGSIPGNTVLTATPTLMDEIKASSTIENSTENSNLVPPTAEETVLTNNERESSSSLKGGISTVFLIKLEDDGSAVYKPVSGEFVGHSLEQGTGYKRERAAYLVDRFLGINLVPPTVVRTLDGELGSVQRYIDGARAGSEIPLEEIEAHRAYSEDEMLKMRVFDYIISNCDRHNGNYLVKDGKLYAIDHAITFHARRFVTEHLYDFEGKKFPQDILIHIKELLASDHLSNVFVGLLSELLNEKEVVALVGRLEKLLVAFSGATNITHEAVRILDAEIA